MVMKVESWCCEVSYHLFGGEAAFKVGNLGSISSSILETTAKKIKKIMTKLTFFRSISTPQVQLLYLLQLLFFFPINSCGTKKKYKAQKIKPPVFCARGSELNSKTREMYRFLDSRTNPGRC